VIGNGLQLQSSIDHDELGLSSDDADRMEREQEREFALFCATADFSRVQCFAELQFLIFSSALDSGDCIVVRRYRKDAGDTYGTKLQVIEADRLSNPNRAADTDQITDGVECNPQGVPVAYHITDRHPGDLRGMTRLNWERVPARTPQGKQLVIHLYDRLRPGLTRGVPYLAPVIEHLKQLGDYTDAELRAAVVSAFYTVFIETDSQDNISPIAGDTDPTLATNEVKLGSGAVIGLAPGEKANNPTPGRPNLAFDPFVQALLRQIGVALELPFELLIKHFTASYSASRAAIEMAWQFFRRKRSWVGSRLCQVTYEWCMDEAVASGRLNRPGYFDDPIMRQAYLGSEWIGPSRPSINPKAESDADKQDMEIGVKTGEQICMERTGGQIEKKLPQLGKENRMRAAAGLPPLSNSSGGQQAPAQPAPVDTSSGSDAETGYQGAAA
jgi:lambda family phage portal protein